MAGEGSPILLGRNFLGAFPADQCHVKPLQDDGGIAHFSSKSFRPRPAVSPVHHRRKSPAKIWIYSIFPPPLSMFSPVHRPSPVPVDVGGRQIRCLSTLDRVGLPNQAPPAAGTQDAVVPLCKPRSQTAAAYATLFRTLTRSGPLISGPTRPGLVRFD